MQESNFGSFIYLDQSLKKLKVSETGDIELTTHLIAIHWSLQEHLTVQDPLFNPVYSLDEPLFPHVSLKHDRLRSFFNTMFNKLERNSDFCVHSILE